jgi:hypothetical protein
MGPSDGASLGKAAVSEDGACDGGRDGVTLFHVKRRGQDPRAAAPARHRTWRGAMESSGRTTVRYGGIRNRNGQSVVDGVGRYSGASAISSQIASQPSAGFATRPMHRRSAFLATSGGQSRWAVSRETGTIAAHPVCYSQRHEVPSRPYPDRRGIQRLLP